MSAAPHSADVYPVDAAAVAPSPSRAAAAPSRLTPLRDATLATTALVAAIAAGSGAGADLDPALFGYLGATLIAAFALAWRASAFWRRAASAFYGKALLRSLREPAKLRRSAAFAGRDLAAQDFLRRRSTLRWLAHMLLSLGTLASFAITLPLVFGWMHFAPAGERDYRLVLFTVPTLSFSVDGAFGWLLFHALALAGVAVTAGAAVFLALRFRSRRLPGVASGFALAPLFLLLVVALTGLALPASRGWPLAFHCAAVAHQTSVVVLLVALPFSKLSHVLVRPLQLGARAVRAPGEPWQRCRGCDEALAPVAQHASVASLLARRGLAAGHLERCPACRRRDLAVAQARQVDSSFQPRSAAAPHREIG